MISLSIFYLYSLFICVIKKKGKNQFVRTLTRSLNQSQSFKVLFESFSNFKFTNHYRCKFIVKIQHSIWDQASSNLYIKVKYSTLNLKTSFFKSLKSIKVKYLTINQTFLNHPIRVILVIHTNIFGQQDWF